MHMGLPELNRELLKELELLEYPPAPWLESSKDDILDVAIIGGGMAGLAAAFALMREGISNIRVFDSSSPGLEGPWKTCARMRTLRSEMRCSISSMSPAAKTLGTLVA